MNATVTLDVRTRVQHVWVDSRGKQWGLVTSFAVGHGGLVALLASEDDL